LITLSATFFASFSFYDANGVALNVQ